MHVTHRIRELYSLHTGPLTVSRGWGMIKHTGTIQGDVLLSGIHGRS